MRRILIADLLCTTAGRAQLRTCIADPVVGKSEDVETGAAGLPEAKRGSGNE